MNIAEFTLLSKGLIVTIALLLTALILAFIRLIKGPTLPDRIVALDLIATVIMGFIAIYAIGTNKPVYLDVSIAIALTSFIGTVAFARYLERGTKND